MILLIQQKSVLRMQRIQGERVRIARRSDSDVWRPTRVTYRNTTVELTYNGVL